MLIAIALAALLVTPAGAQPAPPAMLEKAVSVLAAQRDAAANAAANSETRALMCTDENAALKKRVEELEAAVKASEAKKAD